MESWAKTTDGFKKDHYGKMALSGIAAGGIFATVYQMMQREMHDINDTLSKLEMQTASLRQAKAIHAENVINYKEAQEIAQQIEEQKKTNETLRILIEKKKTSLKKKKTTIDDQGQRNLRKIAKMKFDNDQKYRARLASILNENKEHNLVPISKVASWIEIERYIKDKAKLLINENGENSGNDYSKMSWSDIGFFLNGEGEAYKSTVSLIYDKDTVPCIYRANYANFSQRYDERLYEEYYGEYKKDEVKEEFDSVMKNIRSLEYRQDDLDNKILSRSNMMKSIYDIMHIKNTQISEDYFSYVNETDNIYTVHDFELFVQLFKLYNAKEDGTDKPKWSEDVLTKQYKICERARNEILRVIGALRSNITFPDKSLPWEKSPPLIVELSTFLDECTDLEQFCSEAHGECIREYIDFAKESDLQV
tara:strand:- start:303 stop:1565 length:1263 start_codon:yes stop_codon:yes gene_type:complete